MLLMQWKKLLLLYSGAQGGFSQFQVLTRNPGNVLRKE